MTAILVSSLHKLPSGEKSINFSLLIVIVCAPFQHISNQERRKDKPGKKKGRNLDVNVVMTWISDSIP